MTTATSSTPPATTSSTPPATTSSTPPATTSSKSPATTSSTQPATTSSKSPATTGSTPSATKSKPAPAPAAPADKAEQEKVASVISRWYKWSKSEQKERDPGKKWWYIAQKLKDADKLSSTTAETKKDDDDEKPPAIAREIEAVPSYSLRSTAIYSPPYGDRILLGRLELMTDSSGFKFYHPDQRLNQPAGDHTRSTMYTMNTSSKKTPLPLPSTSILNTAASGGTGEMADHSALPMYVSRGLQTDLEPEPSDLSGTPHIRYYEKQQPKVILIGNEPSTSQPVLPPIEKTPIWVNNTPLPQSSLPATVKETIPTQVKDTRPLSSEAHDKALEELRKRNKDAKGGTYRVKKVHILEKSDVQNSQPPPLPPPAAAKIPSKAGESILRSENLFFNRLFRRKK